MSITSDETLVVFGEERIDHVEHGVTETTDIAALSDRRPHRAPKFPRNLLWLPRPQDSQPRGRAFRLFFGDLWPLHDPAEFAAWLRPLPQKVGPGPRCRTAAATHHDHRKL